MGHRKYVPHCPFRNAVAVLMSVVTAGVWIPFTPPRDVADPPEDEEFSAPPPVFEAHAPISWPEQVVPHPPVAHGATRHPRPRPNPAVDPTHSQPTPKVTVRKRPRPPVDMPPATVPPPPAVHMSVRDTMIGFLRDQLGKPYVFGGNGPNVWDCSGLTKAAYARVGVYLPRTSMAQSLVGVEVSTAHLSFGDLVFWGVPGLATHVGVYVGNDMIIAAQNPLRGVIEFNVSYLFPSFARRVL